MIYESVYWKEELFRNSKWIVESLTKKRWTERSLGKLEKCIMLSAYSIRKLGESKKLSTEYLQHEINTYKYPVIKNIENSYLYCIAEHYDLVNKIAIKLKISFILNQIIHSFIFNPYFVDNNLTGIMLNSDKTKDKNLYFLDIKVLVDIFLYISNGNIVSFNCTRYKDGLNVTNVIYKSTIELSSIGTT